MMGKNGPHQKKKYCDDEDFEDEEEEEDEDSDDDHDDELWEVSRRRQ